MTAAEAGPISSPSLPRPPHSQNKNVAPPQQTLRKRLTMLSWNAGSLAPASWDMLQQWMDEHDIDILAVQETHWPFSRAWMLPRYNCIHSGLSGRQAGLLCLISKRLCSADQISCCELDPGRLVHIRLHRQHGHLDFLHGYQHVHSSNRLDSRQNYGIC